MIIAKPAGDQVKVIVDGSSDQIMEELGLIIATIIEEGMSFEEIFAAIGYGIDYAVDEFDDEDYDNDEDDDRTNVTVIPVKFN